MSEQTILGLSYKRVPYDSRKTAPKGFVFVGYLPDDENIDLQIGLHGRDTPGLVKRLYEISTPGNPSYGKYLSKEEAESYVRPPDEIVDAVRTWFPQFEVPFKFITPSNNRLQITLPVWKANKIFKATFSKYFHTETGTTSYQTLSYSLPASFDDVIESIEPTTSFPNPPSRPTLFTLDAPDSPKNNIVVTPSVLTMLYGIPTTEATQKDNLLSVVGFSAGGFLNQYANRFDLDSFLRIHRPDLFTPTRTATFTDQSINGGVNKQDAEDSGGEANLDIQYTVGLVNFAPVEFITSGTADINSWIDMADHWLKQEKPPTVVSISYGFKESQVSEKSARTLSNRYAQLGALGVSILVSTGDDGVAPSYNPPYNFTPNFPASCPYVTAVGSTRGYPEVTAPLSSGGFSNHFARDEAPYQKDAVDGYLDQIGSLYEGRFNRSGRAYPDISAQGDNGNVVIVNNRSFTLTGGTSAAAPICASVITLLNDRLLRQKGRSLGFLNPLLYQNPSFLNDITEGINNISGDGFPAKLGWDAATGIGTPNFAKMEKVIISPSISNSDQSRNLWVKDSDGKRPIAPGASIFPYNMVPGNYEIAFTEDGSPPPPPPPPGTNVFVANVGKGDLVFTCPWIDAETFVLPSGSWKALADVDYVVSSANDH